jgi:hypothetical protein
MKKKKKKRKRISLEEHLLKKNLEWENSPIFFGFEKTLAGIHSTYF